MDTPLHRNLIALGFAVFWTVFMVWWSADYDIVNILILSVGGLIVGYTWVWAMGRIQRWKEARGK
jgi:hypothetical protein